MPGLTGSGVSPPVFPTISNRLAFFFFFFIRSFFTSGRFHLYQTIQYYTHNILNINHITFNQKYQQDSFFNIVIVRGRIRRRNGRNNRNGVPVGFVIDSILKFNCNILFSPSFNLFGGRLYCFWVFIKWSTSGCVNPFLDLNHNGYSLLSPLQPTPFRHSILLLNFRYLFNESGCI
jgi:hypothetical protein